MKYGIAPFHEARKLNLIIEVTFNRFEWQTAQVTAVARYAHECSHTVAVVQQRADEICTDKTRCSGDKGTHTVCQKHGRQRERLAACCLREFLK